MKNDGSRTCIKLFEGGPLGWSDAKKKCQKLKADLLMIKDKYQDAYLEGKIQSKMYSVLTISHESKKLQAKPVCQ